MKFESDDEMDDSEVILKPNSMSNINIDQKKGLLRSKRGLNTLGLRAGYKRGKYDDLKSN